MKTPPVPRLQIVIVTLLLFGSLLSQALAEPPDAKKKTPEAKPKKKSVAAAMERDEAGKLEERFDSSWGRLSYPHDRIPPGDWRKRALRHIERNIQDNIPEGFRSLHIPGRSERDSVIVPGVTWTEMGPTPLDSSGTSTGYKYGIVSGRVNAVAFHPANGAIAYAGFTDGGLWKTTNCCSSSTTWQRLWDSATFPAQSIGAITVDPSDPNVIYVGTGDSQVPGHGDGFSNGIYKSVDAGATWKQYGENEFSPYVASGAPDAACCAMAPDENVKVIAIDPNNTDTIIAGASFGIYLSYDAGVTWTRYDIVDRTAAAFRDDAQRVTGLLVDGNTNPSTMYVAVGYPYESSRRPGLKGGANGIYKALVPSSGAPVFTLKASSWPAGTGSGTPNDVGRIELDWSSDHSRIYALVGNYGATNTANVGATLGIYTTSNGGDSWTLLGSTGNSSFSSCGGESLQDWYNYYLAVDKNNDKILYVGRVNLWKITVNAGYTAASTLQNLSGVYSTVACGYGTIHPDQHAIAIQPSSNPTRLLLGNDGGLYYGTGAVGGFTQLNAGVNANQFYAGQMGADFSNTGGLTIQYLFGGMQDNGSASWDSSQTNLQWVARSVGGDGFFTAFDPLNGSLASGLWMTEYTNGDVDCSVAGAAGAFTGCAPNYGMSERTDWSTPFLMDQWNCTNLICNNIVLGSTTVWAAASRTAMGKPNWKKSSNSDLTKNNGRYSQIVSIDVAKNNPGSVIVGTGDGNFQWSNSVFTGAACTAANANTAAFSCTASTSATWINLTGSNAVLPNRYISGVSFSPTTNTVFYAAVGGFDDNTPTTPGHIFRGTCSADPCTAANVTWTNKTGALPDIPFDSVAVNPNNANQVFAGSWLGFFYTNDITANPPIWYRYMEGMPNTRVQYLAVDRGAAATPKASTALAAFTYGRGVYTVSIGLPAIAAPRRVNNIQLAKNDSAGSDVTCSWDVTSCAPAAPQNYNILYGWGSGLSTYTLAGSACNIGRTGTFNWTDTPAIPGGETLMWWLIVESDGFSQEGSWGLNSSLLERNGSNASGHCDTATRVNASCP